MMPRRPRGPGGTLSGEHGFTLIELAVAGLLLLFLTLLAVPAIQNLIVRSKLEGAARETGAAFRQARQEAIRRSVPVVVQVDIGRRELLAFTDVDRDGSFDPPAGSPVDDDRRLLTLPLPSLIRFGGPPEDPLAVTGFAGDAAVFQSDGSVSDQGAVRLRDEAGNFLEVRVAPAATGRIVVRKWLPEATPGEGAWRAAGEEGKPWSWQL